MIQAINAFMFNRLQLEEIFTVAKESGVNTVSVEIRHLSDPNLDKYKEKYGISVNSAGALFLNLDNLKDSINEALKAIELCKQHGIPAINAVLSSKRDINDWMKDAVYLCNEILDAARKAHITINIEPLNPDMREVSCITNLLQITVLLRYIESDYLGVTIDLFHLALMPDSDIYLEELLPRIGNVHLADVGIDKKACKPGKGLLRLKKYLPMIIDYKPDITVELEVISDEMESYPVDRLVDYVKSSFVNVSKTVIIGELCVHRYEDDNSRMFESSVGGGAGVMASQINALGSTSYLVGICGDDRSGNEITEYYQAEYGFSDIIRQEAGYTADVRLNKDKIKIVPGNIQIGLLEPVIENLNTEGCNVYLPLFPGYENLYKILSARNNRLICDFGYHEWCGDYAAIEKRLSHFPKGYCALINAKGLDDRTKINLGKIAAVNGFEYAIVTDRGKNLYLVSSDSYKKYGIIETPEISECGAGDSMIAGILVMLERGYSMEDALLYGISVAYKKVQKNGAWKKKYGKSLY